MPSAVYSCIYRGVARKIPWEGQAEPRKNFLTTPKNFTPDLEQFKSRFVKNFPYFVKKYIPIIPKLEQLLNECCIGSGP